MDQSDEPKTEKHLKLLKEEYIKLQKSYAELEQKYNKAVASNQENGEFSSFITRLAMLVAGLYQRKQYSDITIKLKDKEVPAHKFILSVRSEEWKEELLSDLTELDWSYLENEVGNALLRWVYTDAVDLQHDSLALGLLRAAHSFKLAGLLGLCERALVSSVGVRSCVRFYCVAEEVGASSLQDYCSGLISTHWENLTTQDFEHMSSPLLFKMLKNKTNFPLHTAVRLLREDVVFMCLVEAEHNLSEVVNTVSPQGLPLGIALSSRSRGIAETLVQSGKANVDAITDGCSLLIDAIKRKDVFSAEFLLEQNCNVDLKIRSTGDSALHLLCSLTEEDFEALADLINIGRIIVNDKHGDINCQNNNGETPLHIAIQSKNNQLIDLLLDQPNINVNLRTKSEQSALEYALTPPFTTTPPFDLAARLLKEKNACPNSVRPQSNDSLLQVICRKNLEEACIFLLDYDNGIDHKNNGGENIVHLACENGQARFVKVLLDRINGDELINSQTLDKENTALHIVIESENENILKLFVDFNENNSSKIDFNLKNSNGESPLKMALNKNKLNLVQMLITGGSNLNEKCDDMTLLHEAILKEDIPTALFLLKEGADINILTANNETALQLAIHCRLPKVVDALCSHGVLLSSADNKTDCPLWTALDSGELEIAEILVKHGIDTDCWSGNGPGGCLQTLLHRAIDENKEQIALFLIKSGCDLDSPRQQGPNGEGQEEIKDKYSPLHLCAQWGIPKVIKKLLDHGANANAVEADSKTPLHIAIEGQHNDIVEMLLQHPSIDLRMRDKQGNTPFATAVTVRNHKAAQFILDRFPNAAEQIDQRGRNFLHTAIMKNDLESVLFLLAITVDVNSKVHDANQTPPLHLAAASENEMLVRNLILAGSRINERDATSKTALHVAVEKNRVANVTALLQNGADFDATNNEGNNALHLAVREGHLGVVRELLTESRINAETLNSQGRNPLLELCRCGKDNSAMAICELFIESMPQYPINQPDLQGNTPLLLAYMKGQAGLCKVLVKNGACLGAENKDGISIFNYQLATKQLLHKLLDQLPKESPWATSEMCQECGEKFSLIMRKHHCRHCGRNLCSKCSNNEVPIVKFQINKPVRVCTVCFEVLKIGSE